MSPRMRTRRDGSSTPSRRHAVQPVSVIWLTVVWTLLWGFPDVLIVLSGVLVAVLVCLVFPMPRLRLGGRLRPVALARLLGHVAVDVVAASVQVALIVLRPRCVPRSAVVAVPLRAESDLVLTTVAVLVSLVPGSVVVETRRSTHTLYLHVLDVADEGAAQRYRDDVLALEARVLAAFAPEDPGADVGAAAAAGLTADGGAGGGGSAGGGPAAGRTPGPPSRDTDRDREAAP
ncbi:Na+/H+ antiporter subunit E [Nocardioides sp. Leaf374]|uniref:Na+/H+ antiporter subunit E n=1 Tax=Nocardioides sp. Leaf374 TaxID=2876560 RepID=UPI001E49CDBE|nr:Na+/H+ antiporter subunit E [Nocardioides sp. Leaf374]